MADLTAASRMRLPLVVRIGLVYLAARVVTTGLLLAAAELSGPGSRFGADATILDFVLGWDAQWYWLVAVNGYPTELPVTEGGFVGENAWAFMPVFPFLADLAGAPWGGWGAGALVVSLVAGYLACLALHRLLHLRIGSSAALWAVAFFAAGPLGALFQVGYAESLFLLLLFLALDAVARRSFGRLYLILPVMAFTRPGILAFALYLALYGILRWFRRRRDPLPVREAVHIVALGLLSAAAGFSWQVIAGVVTGVPDAYLATELAWRRQWGAAEHGFVPGEGWLQAAQFWFAHWGLPPALGVVAVLVLAGLAASALLFLPAVRALGADLRLWSASYLVYLLAVFFPQSSTFRLLLPLSPLWGAVALPRALGYRLAVLALCVIGQWLWIYHVYAMGSHFWQVP